MYHAKFHTNIYISLINQKHIPSKALVAQWVQPFRVWVQRKVRSIIGCILLM